MSEVDAIKAVSDAIEPLEKDAQMRVLAWATAKFGTTPINFASTGATSPVINPPAAGPAASAATAAQATPKSLSKGKPGKKAKTVISMDKGLNLTPQGKLSAVAFAGEKLPSNVKEKCVVAVYYLRDVIEVDKVTVQGVFTFFKTVQWPAPADMKNTLQQAGTEGWLDTADGEDIKLTSLGENLIEHKLPKMPKA
ncbi:MAG: hypothetical protein V4701_06360 [Pseudomonadota bacterium]